MRSRRGVQNGTVIASNDVCRFGRTGGMRIDFNLNRRVPDAEMLMKFMRKPYQKLVAGMGPRHEAVTSQRRISCAHRPDMQVMNCCHPRLLQKKAGDLIGLNLYRYCIKGHADLATQQGPCAHKNDYGNREAYKRIRAASSLLVE